MVYPATTSCRPAPEARRLAWIDGAATLTMDASSTAMNWPMRTTARTRPGRTGRSWPPSRPERAPRVRMLVMTQACRPYYPGTKTLLILVLTPPGSPPRGRGRLGIAAGMRVSREPKGRGADWTDERGTSEEGRRRQ